MIRPYLKALVFRQQLIDECGNIQIGPELETHNIEFRDHLGDLGNVRQPVSYQRLAVTRNEKLAWSVEVEPSRIICVRSHEG